SSIGAVKGPMAIRYPRGNGSKADWQTPMKRLPVGKGVAVDIKDGAKVALLSIGTMLPSASDAVRLASEQGVATDLYDMRYVKPIDEEILKGIVAKGQKIVTVEDGALAGGFGSAVIEWLADNGYSLPVRRIGIPDGFVAQGTVKELHALCGLDSASIAEALIETAKQ
ncbi:MAG: 1-deoxy-D-xylulose-5-phosphate synthase, partial [Muribaculaceae bacterium]|nr:1-deoxy-D-xylulose-5-phosphate synthase [Muribaculaceae bacterium]